MESTQKEISLVKTSWLNDKYRLLVHKLLSRLEGGILSSKKLGIG